MAVFMVFVSLDGQTRSRNYQQKYNDQSRKTRYQEPVTQKLKKADENTLNKKSTSELNKKSTNDLKKGEMEKGIHIKVLVAEKPIHKMSFKTVKRVVKDDNSLFIQFRDGSHWFVPNYDSLYVYSEMEVQDALNDLAGYLKTKAASDTAFKPDDLLKSTINDGLKDYSAVLDTMGPDFFNNLVSYMDILRNDYSIIDVNAMDMMHQMDAAVNFIFSMASNSYGSYTVTSRLSGGRTQVATYTTNNNGDTISMDWVVVDDEGNVVDKKGKKNRESEDDDEDDGCSGLVDCVKSFFSGDGIWAQSEGRVPFHTLGAVIESVHNNRIAIQTLVNQKKTGNITDQQLNTLMGSMLNHSFQNSLKKGEYLKAGSSNLKKGEYLQPGSFSNTTNTQNVTAPIQNLQVQTIQIR